MARPKGIGNKPKLISWNGTDRDPASYLATVFNDVNERPDLRVKAAVALMPFVHRRLPQELEVDTVGTINVIIQRA